MSNDSIKGKTALDKAIRTEAEKIFDQELRALFRLMNDQPILRGLRIFVYTGDGRYKEMKFVEPYTGILAHDPNSTLASNHGISNFATIMEDRIRAHEQVIINKLIYAANHQEYPSPAPADKDQTYAAD